MIVENVEDTPEDVRTFKNENEVMAAIINVCQQYVSRQHASCGH